MHQCVRGRHWCRSPYGERGLKRQHEHNADEQSRFFRRLAAGLAREPFGRGLRMSTRTY